MKKEIIIYSLIFGSLAGIGCFLFFIGMYNIKFNPLSFTRPSIGINIILIWAAIWYFKRNHGGFIHFYEGFSIGFLTNIIGAFVSGVLVYLFIEFYDYTPFTTWVIEGKALMLKEKETFSKILNDETFRKQMLSFDSLKPYQIILDDLMFKQIAIVPISLLSMALRKLSN
ncbi:DUF4199 domain-containing protein [Lacihabitans lacunae]|jgi:hypothetical protein|uniref:DUF4199 domain-containing protein n=1 Tax=Lacihabitans lacunae TaxID=1028214 RepID=A0ABV7YTI5_9BACT